jgi:hypothetical protein
MHPMKVLFRKIQSNFTSCVLYFVNHCTHVPYASSLIVYKVTCCSRTSYVFITYSNLHGAFCSKRYILRMYVYHM